MTNTHDRMPLWMDLRVPGVMPSREGSLRVAEAQAAARQIASLPDIRAWKVNEVRRRIADGTFAPTSENLADAILARASAERLCR